ncbi:hypothetical protein KY290_005052 [Solanum tuberosum]|uniref:Uncharacterized protein n=1 Tax=Solanum tuberosum TaxID=4113 RepID=A0ABQ7WDH7_SOLTU|nr:hypothetical protein KY285_006367 [Solanum tuberosum]KAH0778625.1 hypothetical protein KY290_005052 [Solanum tuberosum]
MKPLPCACQAYSICMNEECQRQIHSNTQGRTTTRCTRSYPSHYKFNKQKKGENSNSYAHTVNSDESMQGGDSGSAHSEASASANLTEAPSMKKEPLFGEANAGLYVMRSNTSQKHLASQQPVISVQHSNVVANVPSPMSSVSFQHSLVHEGVDGLLHNASSHLSFSQSLTV